jgi:cyanophycinase
MVKLLPARTIRSWLVLAAALTVLPLQAREEQKQPARVTNVPPTVPATRPVLPPAAAVPATPPPAAHAPEPVAKPPSANAQGSLVIIGGGLRGDNADVWQRVVQLAGGKGARIAVFPSAAGNPERAAATIISYLKKYGADAFAVPVAIRLAGSDYRKAADDAALAKKIRDSDGVYFAGGDQGRITKALIREDGTHTLALEAVWELYRRGGVIAGTSAGAAIMSSTMFYNPKAVLSMLRSGITDGHEIAPGLGFIGDDVFVDQHLLVRGRFARMLPAMLKKGYKLGLGIDENTAMVVGPNRDVEVIGYKGALVVDMSRAERAPGKLQRQQRASSATSTMATASTSPAHVSFPRPTRPTAASTRRGHTTASPCTGNDILGNSTVIDLMERLIDSDQPEAIGLDPRQRKRGAAGARLRIQVSRARRRASVTCRPRPRLYSAITCVLDIRPIVVRRPLYRTSRSARRRAPAIRRLDRITMRDLPLHGKRMHSILQLLLRGLLARGAAPPRPTGHHPRRLHSTAATRSVRKLCHRTRPDRAACPGRATRRVAWTTRTAASEPVEVADIEDGQTCCIRATFRPSSENGARRKRRIENQPRLQRIGALSEA